MILRELIDHLVEFELDSEKKAILRHHEGNPFLVTVCSKYISINVTYKDGHGGWAEGHEIWGGPRAKLIKIMKKKKN